MPIYKTQWVECRFEQTEKIDRQTVKIAVEELKKVDNFGYIYRRSGEGERKV